VLKHTRVSSRIDTGRLANAVSRPGIDPRVWVSLAIVKKVVVDPLEGVFVDVVTMPGMFAGTARLGCEYAGNGFGFYAPLEVDDEVLVEAPNGDPGNGFVITKRLFSRSDPPPSQVATNPTDVLLYVKPGKTLRMVVSGGGNAVVEAEGASVVLLGSESATLGVARLGDQVSIAPGLDLASLQNCLDARYALNAPTPGVPLVGTVTAAVTSASDRVRST